MKHIAKVSINILIIITLLLPFSFVDSVVAFSAKEYVFAQDVSGLFRVTVNIQQAYDLVRIKEMGVTILEESNEEATLLVSSGQLEILAKLGYRPQTVDDLISLVSASAESYPWLAIGLRSSLEQAAVLYQDNYDSAVNQVAEVENELLEILSGLSTEQLNGIMYLPGVDSDADGLTDTQESWWCTDPMNPDGDGDGKLDGIEISAIKDWMTNKSAQAPGETPWPSWPFSSETCPDKDFDSIPNLVEKYELGLNMDLESTDHDKFDDGQEVFGVTYCPGGDHNCGYGDLPRSSDAGYVGQAMPSWVKSPGNHPNVAAFPKPVVTILPSSLKVETVTVVTTDHVILSGTEKSYTTSDAKGTSTSASNTISWNQWQEYSESFQEPVLDHDVTLLNNEITEITGKGKIALGSLKVLGGVASGVGGCVVAGITVVGCIAGVAGLIAGVGEGISDIKDGIADIKQKNSKTNSYIDDPGACYPPNGPQTVLNQGSDNDNLVNALQGTQYAFLQSGQLINQRLYEISNILAAPRVTKTDSSGETRGGEHSTSTGEYQELTVSNGSAFSSQESWGIATAVDSTHTADLWFSYSVGNQGTDYVREIRNLAFNIYLNEDPLPLATYFVGSDIGGDGSFYNFLPAEVHTFTSKRIPLSLEQMKIIDLGGTVRVELEDLSYGVDELYYQNAKNSNLQILIEDGVDDGDESLDTYLITAYSDDTLNEVISRYFPVVYDDNNRLIGIWSPEYRNDTPSWCREPRRTHTGENTVLWCKHLVSNLDWWQIYSNDILDSSLSLKETPAVPGGVVLIRINSDKDADGYSDRAENRLGTDPLNAKSFPAPEIIAGAHQVRDGNDVTLTLSFLNTGLSDAYGVEAVLIAPNETVTITNNTVGGSGRVKPLKEVVVGSRVFPPTLDGESWSGSAKPIQGGYYTGLTDKLFTFTVQCENGSGCLIGQDSFQLDWSDGVASGSIHVLETYLSPNMVPFGSDGLQLAFLTGKVNQGDTFQVQTHSPRDTFKYTINDELYTPPFVIVSYNDPRGNHRFVIPADAMNLQSPSHDLAEFSGTMIPISGVEIISYQPFQEGINQFYISVDNPTQNVISNSKIHVWFIANDGSIVFKQSAVQNIDVGPNVIGIDFDTDNFLPEFDSQGQYIVLVHWTDSADNILDVSGRHLSNFQADPKTMLSSNLNPMSWDFGSIQKGSVAETNLVLANTGLKDLAIWVGEGSPTPVISESKRFLMNPGQLVEIPLSLDTAFLPVGNYQGAVTIRTNDIDNPTIDLQVTGIVQNPQEIVTANSSFLGPMEELLYVKGPVNQHIKVNFTNTDIVHSDAVPLAFTDITSTILGYGEPFITLDPSVFQVEESSPAVDADLVRNEVDLTGATEMEEYRTETSRVYIWPDGRGKVIIDNLPQVENETNERVQVGVRYDAYVNSTYPNTATWNQALLWMGNNPGSSKANARVLIWFNLPSLPAHAIVDSSLLAMHTNSWYGTNTINTQVFRITGNWTQGNYEPTWNNHPPVDWGTVWNSTDLAKNKEYKYWNITNLVRSWYSGTPNYGMVVRANPENANGFSFYAHENLSNIPQLIVDFHIPPPPTAPTLYAISNADADGNYTVDWSDTPNTTSYQLEENLNGGAYSNVYNGGASIYNATNKGVGYRCYRVLAVNAYGTSGYSGTQCTTINPAPDTPVINPIENEDGNGDYSINWSSVQFATSYELQESLDSGVYNTIYSGASLSHSVTNRAVGQWCYRVRALNASGTGSWSVNQCVMVNVPPNPPALVTPGNGSNVLGRAVAFAWEESTDEDNFPGLPMEYMVRIVPSSDGQVIESPILTETQWVGVVPTDGEYTWRVKAYDGRTWGDWSAPHSFGVFSIAREDSTHTQIAIPDAIDDYAYYHVKYGLRAHFTAEDTPQVIEVKLPKRLYSSVTFDVLLKEASQGDVSLAVDIGNDGSVEWNQEIIWTEAVSLNSTELAEAINAIMIQSPIGGGELVTIPIKISLSSLGDLYLYNLVGVTGVDSDPMVGVGDITITKQQPVETETIGVNARVHNIGIFNTKNLMVAFYVGDPNQGGRYIGSKLVPSIHGGSFVDAEIQWNTSGYMGDQTIHVVLDRPNQIQEMDESNNSASAEFYILTRPDLKSESLALSNPEPVQNETVSLNFALANGGEADSTQTKISVYDGEKSLDGTLVGEGIADVIGQSFTQMDFDWTPNSLGLHRLFVYADVDEEISEFDESNNISWLDVFVGLAGPIKLDSGTASDPVYVPETGYGYIDINQPDESVSCGNQPEQSMRRDPDGEIVYKFDHLLPGHFYHLDITLFECDGAGRQQTVLIDDNQIAGPVDLGDGEVHRLSIRIDPAFYADREVKVSIKAEGIDGAVVSEVNMFDIDYRYADAGGGKDPQYPGEESYGWLDGSAVTAWGTLPYQSVRVDQTDSELRYRFDNLDPDKRYNVHFTFWQPSGSARMLKVQVDGVDTDLVVNTGDYLRHQESLLIPIEAYSQDGSVVVSIIRTNASTGAMVNEIALEEETLSMVRACNVSQTPYFSETYGDVLIENIGAPVGSLVEAISPRGDIVGCFVVENAGSYGFLRIYGEDTTADPIIPGMRAGEIVTYRVNGATATANPSYYWQDDHTSHKVDLNAGSTNTQSILLQSGWNLISFNVEPPTSLVPTVLQSIVGKYDRVLGEEGVYVPTIPHEFNTLKELHSSNGYYVRVNGTTSVSLLVEGIQQPCDKPKELHAGWNWIGAPCSITPTPTALASIEGKYLRIMSLSKTYDPALPDFSTLLALTPGEGYLIFVQEPVTLVYPTGKFNVPEEDLESLTCEEVRMTPFSTIVYGNVNWMGTVLPEGSVVQFITPRGEVAGCTKVLEDGKIPLTQVYGSDDDELPGFREGEILSVKVNGLDSMVEADIVWFDDKDIHFIDANVSGYLLYLPMLTK